MNVRAAFSKRCIPQAWKSKSSGLDPAWMKPQSDQPYSLHSAWSRTRASSRGSSRSKYAAAQARVRSGSNSHSVEVLPSSKHGSLLPE